MGLFRRKSDPYAERARALQAQIAEVEARIAKLRTQAPEGGAAPAAAVRVAPRSANVTPATAPPPAVRPPPTPPVPAPRPAPVAVPVVPERAKHPELYNDLGVRKFDLAEAFRRVRAIFVPPPPPNPPLTKYLASGGLRELRPLRYEKRVARNRFFFLVGIFTIVLWFIISIVRNHQ